MSIFIGVDIGTTHVKVLAVTNEAELLAEEKQSYAIDQPQDGYCEQDAQELFNAFLYTFKKVLQNIDVSQLQAVCFSTAYHSIMAVDNEGRSLTKLITWADTRSVAYAKQLQHTAMGKTIFQHTGTPLHPMSPLCKIAWLRDKLPELFSQAHKFISFKEYLWYQLFGVYCVDYSVASASGLFNIQQLIWEEEALRFCGIHAEQLSRPVSPLHTATGLRQHYRETWNLLKDVTFVIGAGDGALANLGAGAITPGVAALTIGTSGAIRRVSDQPVLDEQGRLFTYLLTDHLYVQGGAMNNGGIALQWFVQNFLTQQETEEESIDLFFQSVQKVPAGSDGLVFLPYLLGERAPVWDAEAKAVFIGIKSSHTRQHFMRAVIEGICFAMRQLLQLLETAGTVETIYATGGFTRSPVWLQMLADILHKKIVLSSTADASAMGAVFMAMHAKGVIRKWQDVHRLLTCEKAYEPRAAESGLYETNIRVFGHLYEKLKDDFVLLSRQEKNA